MPDDRPHVLLLGGTTEGRTLARRLTEREDVRVTTSLAGRVVDPAALPGRVRVGGFGGVEGLTSWLVAHRVAAVVDATHPFAATMTGNAAAACARAGVGLVRLARPPWTPGPGDAWHPCADLPEAAAAADRLGRRLLVTTGRQGAAAFAGVTAWCLMRSIEPPEPPLPARHEILLDRGPFTVAGERDLLARRGIDVLVTKNSGGEATAAKLVAARDAGVPVVLVERPPAPPGVAVVADVESALEWLAGS